MVGVLASDQGPVVCDAGADVAAAWGRKWAPLLSSLGVTGKAGESVRLPTNGVIKAQLLVLVGLGTEPDDTAVRRTAGVAASGRRGAGVSQLVGAAVDAGGALSATATAADH